MKIITLIAFPLIGAGIGYAANKIAIRMLFRPLKPWRIFRKRIPLTPGLIPATRHALAITIGDLVGKHLFTAAEIDRALKKSKFQDHLLAVIKERVGIVFNRELGPVAGLVPENFRSYFDVAVKAVMYQAKKSMHAFLCSEEFGGKAEQYIESLIERSLEKDLESIVTVHEREIRYACIETSICRFLTCPALDQWVEQFVYRQVCERLQQENSLHDVLPVPIYEGIIRTIENQIPVLLGMGAWTENEEIREKAAEMIRQACISILKTPLSQLTGNDQDFPLLEFCTALSRQVLGVIRSKEALVFVSSMVRDTIEAYCDNGASPVKKTVEDLFGKKGVANLTDRLKTEGRIILRSQETVTGIDVLVEAIIHRLLARPVGRLSDLLPAGVRDGIYLAVRNMALAMLAHEVPGLALSLNINSIVAEKLDSLDLLSLERRLLFIMKKRLQYISFAGALAGFVLGCLNLLFI